MSLISAKQEAFVIDENTKMVSGEHSTTQKTQKWLAGKSLVSIKFVAQLPKLKRLIALGTTVINDFDTTPAENVSVFWGSSKSEYNKHYPEKEIK